MPTFLKNKKMFITFDNVSPWMSFFLCLANSIICQRQGLGKVKKNVQGGLVKEAKSICRTVQFMFSHCSPGLLEPNGTIHFTALPKISAYLKVQMQIWSSNTLGGDRFLLSKFLPEFEDFPSVPLFLWKTQYSLIVDLQKFLKSWCCAKCGVFFSQADNYHRHLQKYCGYSDQKIASQEYGSYKRRFVGGIYKPRQTIFEILDAIGVTASFETVVQRTSDCF